MTDDLDEIFGIPTPSKSNEETSGSEEAAFSDTINQSNGSSFLEQADKLKTSVSKVGRVSKNKVGNKSGGKNEIQTTEDGLHADETVKHTDARKEEHNAMGDSESPEQVVHEEKVDSTVSKSSVKNTSFGYRGIFHGFVLDSEDHELSNFYNVKQDALATWLLPGGALNFNSIMDELRQARPDLSTVVFGDMESMFVALRQIQKWKDRLTSMQVDVNQQYFPWKRAMELFRGTLARHRYEKPSERQEGVVMEHMGDMVMYFSKLESVHASISAVIDNLDAAFECISRQITTSVSTIGKDAEVVERRVNSSNLSSGDMNEFDKIGDSRLAKNNSKPASGVSRNKNSKAGETDWI